MPEFFRKGQKTIDHCFIVYSRKLDWLLFAGFYCNSTLANPHFVIPKERPGASLCLCTILQNKRRRWLGAAPYR